MLNRSNLYAYQHKAIQHIKDNPKCALWVDMGLGKTVSTLTAFSDLHASLDARRMLVVAPKRVARDVWDAEVETWSHLHGLTVSKIVGSTKQKRLDGLRVPADIHTINRENLSWLFSGYVEEISKSKFKQIRRWPWDMVALDEAQSFKNASSSRTKAAINISKFGLADRIVELTGQPAPNGYKDLWSQMFILDHGHRLGADHDDFLKRWFKPPPGWGFKWTIHDYAREEIQEKVRDLVLSMQAEDYLDLPPVMYNEIRVKLSPAVMRAYEKFQRSEVLKLPKNTITAANAGVLGGKLLQMASGAMYTDEKGSFEQVHNTKLDALCEALDELSFSGPVIIGYGFQSETARISERLARYCTKDQKHAVLKSAASLKAFARGEIDFGIMHPATGGHGLNDLYLSGAENIIWIGPTNNLEWWNQLNARIAGGHRRMGRNVRIQVILATGTVDEDYMRLTQGKDEEEVELIRALRERF